MPPINQLKFTRYRGVRMRLPISEIQINLQSVTQNYFPRVTNDILTDNKLGTPHVPIYRGQSVAALE